MDQNFPTKTWQFIHQSKDLVEFLKKMLFLNFFIGRSGHKNPKIALNHVFLSLALEAPEDFRKI